LTLLFSISSTANPFLLHLVLFVLLVIMFLGVWRVKPTWRPLIQIVLLMMIHGGRRVKPARRTLISLLLRLLILNGHWAEPTWPARLHLRWAMVAVVGRLLLVPVAVKQFLLAGGPAPGRKRIGR
jgi:hypothetical protein